jgi:hypothetical protein
MKGTFLRCYRVYGGQMYFVYAITGPERKLASFKKQDGHHVLISKVAYESEFTLIRKYGKWVVDTSHQTPEYMEKYLEEKLKELLVDPDPLDELTMEG